MREVGGITPYIDWAEQEEGFEFQGTYIRRGKDTGYGAGFIMQDENGEQWSLNCVGHLAHKMDMCNFGDKLLIRYGGTEPLETKWGLKNVHQFKVFNLDDLEESPDDEEEDEDSNLSEFDDNALAGL